MENYNEKVSIGNREKMERLIVRGASLGYGYEVWDIKIKKALFFSYDKQKVKDAVEQLLKDPDLSKLPSEDETPPFKIMILREKHGDYHYDVSTKEKLFKVSLAVVTRRNKEGYWYYKPTEPTHPGFTKDEVDNFPEGTVRNTAVRELQTYEALKKSYDSEIVDWDELQGCIEKNDEKMAYSFLRDRKNHQYEDYEVVELDTI